MSYKVPVLQLTPSILKLTLVLMAAYSSLAHVYLLAPGELALAPPQGLNNRGLQRAGSEASIRRNQVE